jgi:hypothetical protein
MSGYHDEPDHDVRSVHAPAALRRARRVMARGGDCSKAESNKLHGVLPRMPPNLLYLYAPPHLQSRTGGSAAELMRVHSRLVSDNSIEGFPTAVDQNGHEYTLLPSSLQRM